MCSYLSASLSEGVVIVGYLLLAARGLRSCELFLGNACFLSGKPSDFELKVIFCLLLKLS